MTYHRCILILTVAILTGCGQVPPADDSRVGAVAPPLAAPPPPAVAQGVPQHGVVVRDGADPADQPDLKVADASVGRRGRNIGGGIITEPIRQRFLIEDRLTFLNEKKAMDLFHAAHNRSPESHDEYWSEIVDANGLQFPELPAGQRYVYDPQQAQLMVESDGN